MRYRKVNPLMWNDPRFRKLSRAEPNAQTLYWFLRTGPQTGIVPGLYEARAGGLADHLGWSPDAFADAFAEIKAHGLAEADWEAGLVWLPGAIEEEVAQSINTVKGWAKATGALPECELKAKALQHLVAYVDGLPQAIADAFRYALTQTYASQDTGYRIQDTGFKKHTAPSAASERSPPSPSSKPSVATPPSGNKPDVERIRGKRRKAGKRKKKGVAQQASSAPPSGDLFALPDGEERASLMKLLDGKKPSPRDKVARRKVAEWIEKEVLRLYRECREKATGSGYVRVQDKARKSAVDIGVSCIGYGIEPEQLFEYWADPENNSWTGMKFPSLAFLSSEKNVDRAVCSIKPSKASVRTRWPVEASGREAFEGESDDYERLMKRGRRKKAGKS